MRIGNPGRKMEPTETVSVGKSDPLFGKVMRAFAPLATGRALSLVTKPFLLSLALATVLSADGGPRKELAVPSRPDPNSEFAMTVEERGKAVAALAKRCVPFNREAPDFTVMDNAFAKAEVIGIGQSTHGTMELFRVQGQLLKHLIEKQGVRTFLLEETVANGMVLDGFVRDAPYGDFGKLADLMDGSFMRDTQPQKPAPILASIYQNTDYLEMFVGIRSWNRAHPNEQVRVYGIDPQYPWKNVYVLIRCLPKQDQPRFEELDKMIEELRLDALHFSGGEKEGKAGLVKLDACEAQIRKLLAESERACSSGKFPLDLKMVEYLGKLLKGGLAQVRAEFEEATGVNYFLRDLWMGSAVNLVRKGLAPTGKMAVFAHSGHLDKGGGGGAPMGMVLGADFAGEKYCSVSCYAMDGVVGAFDFGIMNQATRPSPLVKAWGNYRIPIGDQDTFEGLMAAANPQGDAILRASETKMDLKAKVPFAQFGVTMYPEGTSLETYQSPCKLSESWDFVIALRNTTATLIGIDKATLDELDADVPAKPKGEKAN
jgi:erythromycin esterase-like protein